MIPFAQFCHFEVERIKFKILFCVPRDDVRTARWQHRQVARHQLKRIRPMLKDACINYAWRILHDLRAVDSAGADVRRDLATHPAGEAVFPGESPRLVVIVSLASNGEPPWVHKRQLSANDHLILVEPVAAHVQEFVVVAGRHLHFTKTNPQFAGAWKRWWGRRTWRRWG